MINNNSTREELLEHIDSILPKETPSADLIFAHVGIPSLRFCMEKLGLAKSNTRIKDANKVKSEIDKYRAEKEAKTLATVIPPAPPKPVIPVKPKEEK